ncbi:serine/threonine-protein phosphatase pp2a-related [Anaeramoeba flamelloides]|uniref:Serine/threonine-protein phosphatase n=1 Tax=Anaeramoeba flamelloides TaxID=1746091 RepID=A0ABQ8Y0V5_9EUKA|nr:serine/threonine-protein phosphatase pp2a-related [Anaeramoeba flamelloides]
MSLSFLFNKEIEKIYNFKLLNEIEIKKLCDKAREIFCKEPNIIQLKSPLTVVGDTHGQFKDTQEIFKIAGNCPNVNYLFLGDYVDRGKYGLENFLFLLMLKVRFPNRITLLRGNHEGKQLTQTYGFYDECIRKYGSTDVWKHLTDLFQTIPIAALIENEIFCFHGGLSPSLKFINQIEGLDRFQEIPLEGAMSDLIWGDPGEKDGWKFNPRGAGYLFGKDISKKFIKRNNIKLIARAHQIKMKGYTLEHDNSVLTLFSAPNYCSKCGNEGAVMTIDDNVNRYFIQFNSSSVGSEKINSDRIPNFFLN